MKDKYKGYQKKRLTNNVMKTVMMSSKLECGVCCSQMGGCLAVNIIGNHCIMCELTTGLSNENEMQTDCSSRMFVLTKSEILFTINDNFQNIELVNICFIG